MIVGNLATFPGRSGTIAAVVESLAGQLDRLNVILNEFESIPDVLADNETVHCIIPEQDTKDTGKFLPDCSGADFVFLADDDILYPPDYVEVTLKHLAGIQEEKFVAGYHDSIFRHPSLARICLPRAGNWIRDLDGSQDYEESGIYQSFTRLGPKKVTKEIRLFAFNDTRVGTPAEFSTGEIDD